MEIATPTTPTPVVPPMNQPHTPISMDEMNPNIHNESPSSAKATLLNIASIFVLLGIVGITIWLYIQNKNSQVNKANKNSTDNEQNEIKVTKTPIKEVSHVSENVVCVRFTSLEEALLNPTAACTLDLSGQSLISIPPETVQLKNLQDLDASNNNITIFPKFLTTMKELANINLSDNEIADIPSDIMDMSSLQSLNLSNNQISSFPIDTKTINRTSLHTLNLEGNQISADRVKELKQLFRLR